MGILKKLGEYFFGTETKKFYENERASLGELIKDKKDLKEGCRLSKLNQWGDLILGKYIPNLLDIGAVIYAAVTKTPPYGLAAGEGLRLFMASGIKTHKKEVKIYHNLMKQGCLISETAEKMTNAVEKTVKACEKLNKALDDKLNEGEEWKNN